MNEEKILYISENLEKFSKRDRIFLNNPVIMQGLGLAPIIVPSFTVQNAVILIVAVALLLTPTRIIATLLSHYIPEKMRAIIYVLTSSILFIFISYILDAFLFGPSVRMVGTYLPLLVVEPLIIKRYSSANRETVSNSFKKGIITTIGFAITIILVASLRELLAFGTIGGITFFQIKLFPIAAFPAGGFIMVGIIAAVWRGAVNLFKKKINLGVKKLK